MAIEKKPLGCGKLIPVWLTIPVGEYVNASFAARMFPIRLAPPDDGDECRPDHVVQPPETSSP